jgi:hypothetical protein
MRAIDESNAAIIEAIVSLICAVFTQLEAIASRALNKRLEV